MLILIFLNGLAKAQQDPIYSQYMFNGLAINPAYAGSKDYASATMITRMQWTGMQNAPRSFNFSFHSPTPDRRHGLGFYLYSDKAWVIKNQVLNGCYAFRIPIKKATLALGVQGGFTYYHADLSQVPVQTAGDPAFDGNNVRRLIPNAGAGIYFHSESVFLGVSTPNFLKGKLYAFELFDLSYAERQNHWYANAGLILKVGNSVKCKPSVLLRYVPGVPFTTDINLNFMFAEVLTVGALWRIDNAIGFMAEFRAGKQLRLGYSYDLSTNALSGWVGGSHELRLGYDFRFEKNRMYNPRLF